MARSDQASPTIDRGDRSQCAAYLPLEVDDQAAEADRRAEAGVARLKARKPTIVLSRLGTGPPRVLSLRGFGVAVHMIGDVAVAEHRLPWLDQRLWEDGMRCREEWQDEARDALLSESWSTTGPSRIVKLVPASGLIQNALHGFICLEKSLLGRTPQELQGLLGLPPKCFDMGCRVYRFRKLPLQHEVEYELTAHYPNGLAFNGAMHDPAYAPGSKSIHQWRLLVDVPADHLLDLAPGARYPYLHS